MENLTEFCRDYAIQYAEVCIKYGNQTRANEVKCNNHAVLMYDDCRDKKIENLRYPKKTN